MQFHFAPWPERTWLISRTWDFVYVPIPKVACSSLKRWMLLLDGVCPANVPHVHRHMRIHYSAGAHYGPWARRRVATRKLFRFTFVRNPWDRLVSAFLNKFPQRKPPAIPVIDAVHRSRRGTRCSRSAEQRNITFREFVAWLDSIDLARAEEHWRPQSHFLGCDTYDFVGRFERLADDFHQLQQILQTDHPLPSFNATPRRGGITTAIADIPADQLNSAPAYRDFYDASLRDAVARLYREDIDRFGYTFDMQPPLQSSESGEDRHATSITNAS
ncbi:sulfotransferase family protein [Maioricimonas sp. JC845]|uniref:sulfotransferase family protein n=1 Tax=Maioricimonas sp. JC845 TaxID=3232138 RepID=UPI0034589A54